MSDDRIGPGVQKLVRAGAPALAYELFRPASTPAAAAVLTHGFGEHRLRYRHVIERWNELGILVLSHDLRGHGGSEGRRGHVDRFTDYVGDLVDLLAEVRTLDADFRRLGPPIAFGHSFGGLVTVHLAIVHPEKARAVVLSSPFFALALEVPAYKVAAGRLTSRFLPEFSLPSGLKGTDLTRDPAMVAMHDSDPLNFDLASSRWFTETLAAQKRALELAPRLSLPFFCLQAGEDRIGKASASRAFFELLRGPEKTYRELAGRYHEILNDIDRAEVIDEFARAIRGAYSATVPAAPEPPTAPTPP